MRTENLKMLDYANHYVWLRLCYYNFIYMETVAYYSYCKKCTFTYEGTVNLYYYKQKVYIFLNLFKKKKF